MDRSVTDEDRISGTPKNPRQVRAAVDNDKHGYRPLDYAITVQVELKEG